MKRRSNSRRPSSKVMPPATIWSMSRPSSSRNDVPSSFVLTTIHRRTQCAPTRTGDVPSGARTRRCTSRGCGRRRRPATPGRAAVCSTRSPRGSRARTACRSWAAARRASTWSAGQNRDESGVSASSMSSSVWPSKPNSNFVSASRIPQPSACAAACRYSSRVVSRRRPNSAASFNRSVASASSMLMSWPEAAFVAGVKMGAGRRSDSRSPGGRTMPQIRPVSRYPSSPIPTDTRAPHTRSRWAPSCAPASIGRGDLPHVREPLAGTPPHPSSRSDWRSHAPTAGTRKPTAVSGLVPCQGCRWRECSRTPRCDRWRQSGANRRDRRRRGLCRCGTAADSAAMW